MSPAQRTLTGVLWFGVVISLLGLLAMQRWSASVTERRARESRAIMQELIRLDPSQATTVPTGPRERYSFPAPSFKLTDQENKPFDSDSLKGKVWTAMLFFSECQGICPGMRGRIESLQAAANDPRVHFVSLSVDPTTDTPEKLAKYAAAAKADPARWHMLAGSIEETHRIAAGFKIPFDLPVNHSSKIMLVNQEGVVYDYYDSFSDADMARLKNDVQTLLADSAS